MSVFIDTNVLLDLFTADGTWRAWSEQQIGRFAGGPGALLINAIVYAELAVRSPSQKVLDRDIADLGIALVEPSRAALFAAGQAFAVYRRRAGPRLTILPDFVIGAHAAALEVPLVTRDAKRYRSYFPDLELVTP